MVSKVVSKDCFESGFERLYQRIHALKKKEEKKGHAHLLLRRPTVISLSVLDIRKQLRHNVDRRTIVYRVSLWLPDVKLHFKCVFLN
jgi:hypothetical protein